MQNEKEWFCSQVKQCEKCMYMVANNILRNDEDTKDAIQDAIIKAYTNINSLKDRNSFKAWILKILMNTTMDVAKKRNRNVLVDEIEDNMESFYEPQYEKTIVLKDAIEKLKEPYKTVVILFYYQDFSINEISNIMDTNHSTVKKQLQRAREQLRKMI